MKLFVKSQAEIAVISFRPIKKTAAAGILPAAATKIIFYCSQASRALLNALNANMLPIKAVNAKNATNSENVLSPTDE
jgi:hypothetical protein